MQKNQRAAEVALKEAGVTLAHMIDEAMRDGVETGEIAEWLDLSRQTIYKMVREKVDGQPITQPYNVKPKLRPRPGSGNQAPSSGRR